MRPADRSTAVGPFIGLGIRLNQFLGRDRCIAWSRVLLALELAGFLFLAAFSYGLIAKLPGPVTTSFVSFYAAGALADAGTPALAYDTAAQQRAEDAARTPGIGHPLFTYPPVFLLVCAALARLPYLAAFIGFQAAPLAALALALRRILRVGERGGADWNTLLPFLAFPALWANLALGQNACLSAALFAWGLLLLPARPLLAGLLLGTLCYKPHFGLLLPVALIAGRRWRAVGGAALSVGGCVALSVLAFGIAPWTAYLAALPGMPALYQSGRIAFAAMVSPAGAVLLLRLSPAAADAVQAASALAAAAIVAWVWGRRNPPALCAATLLAATLLTAPVLLFYDLVLAALAIAFLVRHVRVAGWLPYARPALGAVVALSALAPAVAVIWKLPLGPLPALLLLALCIGYIRRVERKTHVTLHCAKSAEVTANREMYPQL